MKVEYFTAWQRPTRRLSRHASADNSTTVPSNSAGFSSISRRQFSAIAAWLSRSNGCCSATSRTSISSTGTMTLRGRSKLKGSRHVQGDCHRAMVGGLRPVPAGAWKALDLLSGRKDGAPGLAAADDVGSRRCVLRRQRLRQQDIVELAEMPLLRPARVIKTPAVHLRSPFDDIFAE